MKFKEVCKRIKELKIQGAENVAFAALGAFASFSSKIDVSNKEVFIKQLGSAKSELFATRATEPMMRNFINFTLERVRESNLEKVQDLKRIVRETAKKIADDNKVDSEKLEGFAIGLMRDNTNVFTHCHASTVMNIFKKAYGVKKFGVYNTETRPLFQGRRTAIELSKANIPVTYVVDSAASVALSNCSAMFIGADAITADGSVVNKIGSGMFARVAASRNVPVYVCAHSWKFDPDTVHKAEEIEQRSPDEVWKNAPAKVKVLNPAFDIVDKKHITAIVSELGVLWPADFVRQVKKSFFLGDSGDKR
ncbi:MAG: hypothetical protein V1914_00205 [archaeon]